MALACAVALAGCGADMPAPPRIDGEVDAWLDAREATFDNIVPGTEKRVLWAGETGERTDWAIVYIHGFSASSEELRPIPERLSDALGANVFYTRLAGHGRDSEAMAEPRVEDWLADMAEALAVGERIGERVMLIGTSNGGALTAIATARYPDRVDAAVLISPVFGVPRRGAFLLEWPGARIWLPWVLGPTGGFAPENPDHALYWTESYPTEALVPVQRVIGLAQDAPLNEAEAPALLFYSPDDKVVSPEAIRTQMAEWGAPVTTVEIPAQEGMDPSNHVLAGDILSPALTEPVTQRILDWVAGL